MAGEINGPRNKWNGWPSQIGGALMPIIPKQRRGGREGGTQRFTLDSVRTAALAHRVNTLLDDLKVRECEIEKYEIENEKYKQDCENQKEITTKLFGFISGLYSLLPESKKSPNIVEGLRNESLLSFNEASESTLSHFSQQSQIDPSRLKDFMTSNQMLLMNNQLHKEMDEIKESNKDMEDELKINKLTITRLTREITTYEDEIRNLKVELDKAKNTLSPETMSQTTNDNNTNNIEIKSENSNNSDIMTNENTITSQGDNHNTDPKHTLSSKEKEDDGNTTDNNANPNQSSSPLSATTPKGKSDTETSLDECPMEVKALELQAKSYRDMFMKTLKREQASNQSLAKLKKEMEETKKLDTFVKQEFEEFKAYIEKRIEYLTELEKEKKELLEKLHSSEQQVMNIEKSYRLRLNELNEELEKEKSKAFDNSQKILELENKASFALTEKQILEENLERKTKELDNIKEKHNELVKKIEVSSGEEDMEFLCAQLEEMESLLKEKEDEAGQKIEENGALKIKVKQAEANVMILEEKLRNLTDRETRNRKDIEMLNSNMERLIELDESTTSDKILLDKKVLELQEILNKGNIEYVKNYTKDMEDGLFMDENGEIDYDKLDVDSEIPVTKRKMLIEIKSLRKELEVCKDNIVSQRDTIRKQSKTIDEIDKDLNEKIRQYNNLLSKSGAENLIVAEKTVEILRADLTCKICNEKPFDVVLKPCGHVLCHVCAEKNIESRSRKCPHCMAKISKNDILSIKK